MSKVETQNRRQSSAHVISDVERVFLHASVPEGTEHVIPQTALIGALYELDLNPAPSRLQAVITERCFGTRSLSREEFVDVVHHFQSTASDMTATVQNFHTLDEDGDWRLSKDEMRAFMAGLKAKDRITGPAFEHAYARLDPEASGFVTVQAFLRGMFPHASEAELQAALLAGGVDVHKEQREAAEKAAADREDLEAAEAVARTRVGAELTAFLNKAREEEAAHRKTAQEETDRRIQAEIAASNEVCQETMPEAAPAPEAVQTVHEEKKAPSASPPPPKREEPKEEPKKKPDGCCIVS